MNVKNIKENMIIKNYKELCGILNEKVKGGKSKQLQLKDWERFFEYHKDKNKFIIDKIYDNPKPKAINPNSKYIEEIQTILTYYLFTHKEDEKVILSSSELINILGLANNTYSLGTYKKRELSDLLEIELVAIYYFYNTTRVEFKGIIERSLNNLEKRGIILLNKTFIVGTIQKKNKITNINKREATKEEKQLILDTEQIVLDSIGISKKDLFLQGIKAYREFIELVNKELPWDFYYKAWDIIMGKYAITSELTKALYQKDNLNLKSVNRIKHILKMEHNYNKHAVENILIDTLISNKEYNEDLDKALMELYQKNQKEYYNKLKKINKEQNELSYNKSKTKEEYENRDIIDLKEYMQYINELKYLKKHCVSEEYWDDLLRRVDEMD